MLKLQSSIAAIVLLSLVFFFPTLISAQPGGPGGAPTPIGVPFDGGLSLIIAAGAGYAIKKQRDYRKKHPKTN